MIKHSVIFTLNYPEGAQEEKLFFSAAARLADIPGVEKFEILKQTSPKNHFKYGIAMEFSSALLYQQYSDHPEHKQFLEDHWTKSVDDFLEIDYEPLPVL